MRKMISFKIENLSDKQRKIVDDWANGQVNIQQSLANIITHIVNFTGNNDVMDYDVQRKLHTIFVNDNISVNAAEQSKVQVEALPGKAEPQQKGNDIFNKADWFNEE